MAERRLDVVIAAHNRTAAAFNAAAGQVRSFVGEIRGLAAAATGIFGGIAIGEFIRQSVVEFGNAEKAASDLRVALEQQGEKAAASAGGVELLAKQLQMMTTLEDDSVIATAALVARLGNLSGQPLQEATKATEGLSRALGISAEAAARIYIRALGGVFTRTATLIPEMANATTTAEKMAVISKTAATGLQLLAADAETSAGSFTRLKVAFGNAMEGVGAAAAVVLTPLSNWFVENSTIVTAWTDNLKIDIAAGVGYFANLEQALVSVGMTAIGAFGRATDAMQTFFDNVGIAIKDAITNFKALNYAWEMTWLGPVKNLKTQFRGAIREAMNLPGGPQFVATPFKSFEASPNTLALEADAEEQRKKLEEQLSRTMQQMLFPLGGGSGIEAPKVNFPAIPEQQGIGRGAAGRVTGLSGPTVLGSSFLGLADTFKAQDAMAAKLDQLIKKTDKQVEAMDEVANNTNRMKDVLERGGREAPGILVLA